MEHIEDSHVEALLEVYQILVIIPLYTSANPWFDNLFIHSCWICLYTQGLLEARQELRPLLFQSNDRLKDILFLDIALDSAVRTAVERGYEELNNAGPEVSYKPHY